MTLFSVPLLPRRVATLVAAGFIVGLVSGCGALGDQADYYQAEPLPPMKVPQGMETRSLEPLYAVPEKPEREDELLLARGYEAYEVPRPDPLPVSGATESGVKIQKLGDERWILIDAPTSQVWPRAQSFLSRYGIGVDVNDPGLGLIETRWVRFKVDAEQKHRYRIWIEQGLRPETTEVHVVHRAVPEAFPNADELDWNRTSDSSEREAFILDELAAELASTIGNSSASLLGQRVGGDAKSDLIFVDEEPVLELKLGFDRAWATSIHAFGEEQFALWDSNPTKGVALVGHIAKAAQDQGFFERLLTDDDLPEEAPAQLPDVLAHLADEPAVRKLFGDIAGVGYGGGEPLPDTYLFVFRHVGDTTLVYVRSAQGKRLSPRVARQILTQVRRNLI